MPTGSSSQRRLRPGQRQEAALFQVVGSDARSNHRTPDALLPHQVTVLNIVFARWVSPRPTTGHTYDAVQLLSIQDLFNLGQYSILLDWIWSIDWARRSIYLILFGQLIVTCSCHVPSIGTIMLASACSFSFMSIEPTHWKLMKIFEICVTFGSQNQVSESRVFLID